MGLEYFDDPKLNKELLKLMNQAIERCQLAYQDQSKSFAIVLQELQLMLIEFQGGLQLADAATVADSDVVDKLVRSSITTDEKLVYVRLFHKQMPSLLVANSSIAWVKLLLESIKASEKHGLAIYADEELVKQSLKNENYAYATLKIKLEQDISEQRSLKEDLSLGCKLLTLDKVSINNILKLTYNQQDYLIKDGVLHRPK